MAQATGDASGAMAEAGGSGGGNGEARMQYSSKLELMLTLVGYAVGLGNVWRFPYLAYSYGGGAFMVPYIISLIVTGIPLFVLELGLGQMFRQGTMGVWKKVGLPRLSGVGIAATMVTFFVLLYYNVILAWTIYYIGRTFGSVGGALPWTDQVEGFQCKPTVLVVKEEFIGEHDLIDSVTGLYNKAYQSAFWCPDKGIPDMMMEVPAGYVRIKQAPKNCPAYAAAQFWEQQALQQSSGMDELGGFQPGMLLSFTIAWVLIYFCICQGVASSGKVVYVTATLPYVALIAFFIRAQTLNNAATGVLFFVMPDFEMLSNPTVWLRAVTQIFYSLGVGFGSLVAFASYGSKHSDFTMDAVKVSVINCGTSVFAGFVVFPILGFLCAELSETDPCIQADDLRDLESVGLSGTGLAFIAFPIAISQMPGSMFWALLFFFMLLCLGIDSQFAMCESVMTVLHDAGASHWLTAKLGMEVTKGRFAAGFCVLSWALGLIFVTRGGLYWFNMFDFYTCVLGLFFVTLCECVGLMWMDTATYPAFVERVKEWTGRQLSLAHWISWKFVCVPVLAFLTVFALTTWDLMEASQSKPYPEGTGYLPPWSVFVGWSLGLLPILGFALGAAFITDGGENELLAREPKFGESASEASCRPLNDFAAGSSGSATRGVELEPGSEELQPGSHPRHGSATTLDGLTQWKGPVDEVGNPTSADPIGESTKGVDIGFAADCEFGGKSNGFDNGHFHGDGSGAAEPNELRLTEAVASGSNSFAPAPRMRTYVKCGPWLFS